MRLTQEQKKYIDAQCTNYDWQDCIRLAKEIGCCAATVCRYLKKSGATKKRALTESQRVQIIDMYTNGNHNVTFIAKELKQSRSTVFNYLKKSNIEINSTLRHKKHTFNKEKFVNIDNADKAYWLGFLIGDAAIDKTQSALHLELSNIDIDHLEKFRTFINGTQHIRPTKKNCSYIIICGKDFISSLSQYGLIPNKTCSVRTPNIAKELLSDFYRGVLDADGWITCHKLIKNGKDQHEYGFSSASIEFLKEIQEWLSNKMGRKVGYLKERIRSDKERVCQLIIGGNQQFLEITKLLYHDNSTTLTRKLQKVQSFVKKITHDDQ